MNELKETDSIKGIITTSGKIVASMIAQKGEKGDPGARGETGSKGDPGISPTVAISKTGKVTTIIITDIDGDHTATINDGNDGSGAGDMLKSVYDTNDNGIVDNAEKVNNHSVNKDVPADAQFTDTTYTAGIGIDITGNVISNTQTSAEWGRITGTLSNQTDLQNVLNSKGTYSKPNDGIPKTDLTNEVQTSLGKADTALQSYTESDPIFSSSAAGGITSSDITNWNNKQNALVSGTNIKTIDGNSILGSGNINVSGDTLPIGAIINYNGTTIPDGYTSIGNDYSTNEVNTGETWYDGKPLYRKVITFTTSLNANTALSIAHDIQNADVIFIDTSHSFVKSAVNNLTIPIPVTVYHGNFGDRIGVHIDRSNLYCYQDTTWDNNWIKVFTILYTKTTD